MLDLALMGQILPCHRFAKFSDNRPWKEKENCIGHVDVGITRPEVRERFINWNAESHEGCKDCSFVDRSPCAGGCYATAHDLTGDIGKPHRYTCEYVKMQKEVSAYLKFCMQAERQDTVNELTKIFGQKQDKPHVIT